MTKGIIIIYTTFLSSNETVFRGSGLNDKRNADPMNAVFSLRDLVQSCAGVSGKNAVVFRLMIFHLHHGH